MIEVPGNLSVIFRSDLNILFCRFIQPVPSALLRNSYENALQKAQENHVQFWLLDLRRRGPALTEDEDWLLEYFFPHVEDITKARHYFAYLVTPTHFLHVKEAISLDKLANFSALIHIAFFDSESEALDWLTSNQTAEAIA